MRLGLYDPTPMVVFVVAAIAILVIAVIALIIWHILDNPYQYPYSEKRFDVSGKRNVDIEDLIDKYLCESDSWDEVEQARSAIAQWKEDTEQQACESALSKRRIRQFHETIDDENAYRFVTQRAQTRYRQANYVKTSYKVDVDDDAFSCSYEWLVDRWNKLAEIDFECTLREWHCKSQRKLMTKKLREEIMERDNYTCQNCGKYMPDKVGLHIDHIVPVARGGKTVRSNLQVLCSVCNGAKGSKDE